MKKVVGVLLVFMLLSFASATTTLTTRSSCDLDVQLINQDPYPAIPGETVKLVFQVSGVESSECKDVLFTIEPEFPFSLEPGQDAVTRIRGGTFVSDYASYLMVPYELRVDDNALEGDNKIKIKYSSDISGDFFTEEEFDVNVEEVKTDFDIFVRDYDASKRELTFEVINVGKNDVEALTLEIPRQENIVVKGSNKNVIGYLDSKDFTTASFEATPSEGDIEVKIHYIDVTDERRVITKTVSFEPDYFKGMVRDQKSVSSGFYFVVLLIAGGVGYYFYRRHKKKKKKKLFG